MRGFFLLDFNFNFMKRHHLHSHTRRDRKAIAMANSKIPDYFRVAGAGSKRKHDTPDQDESVSSKRSSRPYDAVSSLGDLKKGPKRVAFDARIVNIYNQPNIYFDDNAESISRSSKKKKSSKADGDLVASQQARGCLKLILRDDSGYILVCLAINKVDYWLLTFYVPVGQALVCRYYL